MKLYTVSECMNNEILFEKKKKKKKTLKNEALHN